MFGWLADLLVKFSFVGSRCSCCYAKDEQLKQMQKAVLKGHIYHDIQENRCLCHDESCQCGEKSECCRGDETNADMVVRYHYKI
ncbi:MAG: hypothetical protein IJ660_07445 [Alphaproteobacteria bacterium]|nr:hypothetical protein [Alphaproteobacteria bacterium]